MIKADVIIFGGQSNMVGETEGPPESNEPVKGAYEYRYGENDLVELKHPVGEDLFWGALEGSVKGGGSLVPSFCRTYVNKTGRTVVAIHVACGSTTVAEWLHGTRRHYHTIRKINAAFEKIKEKYEINDIYYVWLQGESDAIIQTSEEEYFSKLIQYKNELKSEIDFKKFCIIKIGYFASVADWIEGTKEDKIKRDEAIQRAQERVVESDKDFVMLTRVCTEYSRDKNHINPYVGGHYNNATLDLIGASAAETLSTLCRET